MVTIEDKLNFFQKMVYDRIEEQNRSELKKLEEEWEKLINDKKKEYVKEAEDILNSGMREIQKEKLQIISKAKVEEKRIVLEKRKQIADEVRSGLLEYAKAFIDTDEYKDILIDDLNGAAREMTSGNNIDLYLTRYDIDRFKGEIDEIFGHRDINIYEDNELIGGFVIIDREGKAKYDMSIFYRIYSSKDIIGEKLYEILQ